MRPTQCFFMVLSAIITGSRSGPVQMTVSPEVSVSRGGDAVLSCSFSHSQQQQYSGLISVQWRAREPHGEPFLSCSVKNHSTESVSDCMSPGLRSSLAGDPRRGQLSLLIRSVQLTDEGRYFCQVVLDHLQSQKETQLHVTAGPQILTLSVVETSLASDGAPQRLQCEVEGHPLPKIVWLSASRRLTEDQGTTDPSGPYRVTSSVPYQEGEELTCRAESRVGEAERTYPPSHTLMTSLVVCGVTVLLLLLSAGVIVHCRRTRGTRARHGTSPDAGGHSAADGETESQATYSVISLTSSPVNVINATHQPEELGVLYSVVHA